MGRYNRRAMREARKSNIDESSLVFDEANKIEDYQNSLKTMYGDSYPDEDINQLQERNHEYFNGIDANSVKGGKAIYSIINNLNMNQLKAFQKNMDYYDRTSAFGDGSRSFLEQASSVGSSLLTDPLTYAGLGVGKVITGTAATIAVRGGIKSVLKDRLRALTEESLEDQLIEDEVNKK